MQKRLLFLDYVVACNDNYCHGTGYKLLESAVRLYLRVKMLLVLPLQRPTNLQELFTVL